MAKEITMPKLSDTMEEGKVLRWLKSEGERVERGEVIAEVETDKADMEMEAFDEGVLLAITVPAGNSAAVGDVIGWIGAAGEKTGEKTGEKPGEKPGGTAAGDGEPAEANARGAARRGRAEPTEATSAGTAEEDGPREAPAKEKGEAAEPRPAPERPAAASQPRRRAERPAADANATLPGPHADIADVIEPEGAAEEEEGEEGSARQAPAGGRAAQRSRPTKGLNDRLPPAREPRAREGRPKISPVARRLAQDAGLDPAGVQGSGPDGRIVRRDVERALEERPAAAAPARPMERPPVPVASGRLGEDVPHTKIRRAIATRMAESKRTVPHFYTTAAVRMDEALRLKAALALRDPGSPVSVSHLIVKAAALALERHPRVAATFEEERIRIPSRIDVGLAVAVEDGLVVPVLRDVARKGLFDVAREARELVERVRAGRLAQDDLTGAVFSISNLGMFEIEQFAAIIAPPQSAILAIGGTADEPVVREGAVVPGKVMRVTLSADHRVIDGVLAAAFVVEVKRFLENPLSLVL